MKIRFSISILFTLALLLVCTVSPSVAAGQALDGPGDIAFVGYNADGTDGFAFVLLANATGGQQIQFTDNEWEGSAFNTGEGNQVWTTPAGGLPAGSVIIVENTASGTLSVNQGTITAGTGGSSNLNADNEAFFAYLGSEGSPAAFLAALANDQFSDAGATLSGTGLITGTNAIETDNDDDVMVYNGTQVDRTSVQFLALINDPSNWNSQDGTGNQSQDSTPPNYPDDVVSRLIIDNTSQTTGAWNTASTWSEEREPGTNDNVTIASGHTVTITNTAEVYTLTVVSGSKLTIDGGSLV
ncbi:MAG: hypothetical protein JXA14_07665, partial [Anaerolineae bacterium]|nr:hypothetical protein [Anaerolineae bacterium]